MTKLNTEDGEKVEVFEGDPDTVDRAVDGVQDFEEED